LGFFPEKAFESDGEIIWVGLAVPRATACYSLTTGRRVDRSPISGWPRINQSLAGAAHKPPDTTGLAASFRRHEACDRAVEVSSSPGHALRARQRRRARRGRGGGPRRGA